MQHLRTLIWILLDTDEKTDYIRPILVKNINHVTAWSHPIGDLSHPPYWKTEHALSEAPFIASSQICSMCMRPEKLITEFDRLNLKHHR